MNPIHTMTLTTPGPLPPGYRVTTWTGYTVRTDSAPSQQQQHLAAVTRSLERSLRLNRDVWREMGGK
jgi:hypothetical protein